MRLFLILTVVAMIVLVGGAAFMASSEDGMFSGRSSSGREVRVQELAREDLVEIVSAPGEIEPNVKVDVSAEVSARIMELPFREGEAVRKGDVIIRLDAVAFQARLESSRARRDAQQYQLQSEQSRLQGPLASLENARENLRRQEALFKTGDISRQTLDNTRNSVNNLIAQVEAGKLAVSVLESNLAAAEAEIEQALEALEKTVMRSPIDGVITILQAEVGELVMVGTMNNPGTVIMTIADLSKMRLNARVAESDIARVEEHQPAIVRINAYPDQEFSGTVERIALQRAIDRTGSGYFKTEIQLDLDGRRIYSGLAANVDIEIAQHQGVVVPSQAVLDVEIEDFPSRLADNPLIDRRKRTSQAVYQVVNDEAVLVPVMIGPSNLSDTIISKGLKVGDEVVIGPYKALEKLSDGSRVSREALSPTEQPGEEASESDAMAEVEGDGGSSAVKLESSETSSRSERVPAGSA